MGRRKKDPDPNDDSYPWDFTIRWSDDDDDDDIPECCIACGGPYPSCMSSCSLFDD